MSDDKNKHVDQTNIVQIGDNKILKTIGVYGANGSGKSNIIKAFSFFRRLIFNSLNDEEIIARSVNPFKLEQQSKDNSGFFQCVVLLETKKYRYGFTLSKDNEISSEWLYGPAEKNETYYFRRQYSKIEINSDRFIEGLNLPLEKLRSDALFLSFCSSYDGQISQAIRKFFRNNTSVEGSRDAFRIIPSLNNALTNELVKNGQERTVLNWLKSVGLDYTDIKIKEIDESVLSSQYVFLSKNVYKPNGEVAGTIDMDLRTDESDGTRKFYSYIGKLYQKFENGGLYVIDEIDSNFHPSLLQHLIHMFNDNVINKANAQLLFTSHDTNLMSPAVMRRDQFYFTEKSVKDETILYSLADLKGIRNNADFARQYLAGFYGALPVLAKYSEEKNYDDNNLTSFK